MELNKVVYCLRYCQVLYTDNLLISLKKKDIGCHVGSHFCGAFGYRMTSCFPSVSGLQNILDSSSEFEFSYLLLNLRSPRDCPVRWWVVVRACTC